MGDSVATHFRYIELTSGWVYVPTIVSSEGQAGFNIPHHVSSYDKLLTRKEVQKRIRSQLDDNSIQTILDQILDMKLTTLVADVFEKDLVMVSTDGLHDNLPIIIVALLINYAAKELESCNANDSIEPKIKIISRNFIKEFARMLSDKEISYLIRAKNQSFRNEREKISTIENKY